MHIKSLITLLIVSLGATSAFAKNYYVKPGGSDSNDGLSHATAWKSVSKVNSFGFNTGDDVYFLSGGKWMNQQLNVDWSGTTSNRAVIGAYYMNSGNEIVGVPAGTKKPTFDENWPASGATITTADYYSGLIDVRGDHVTVQDVRISNSIKNGVVLQKPYNNIIVDGIETDVTAATGVRTYGANSIIRNSTIVRAASGHGLKYWKGTWPACVYIVAKENNIVENNRIYDCYGEGIGVYRKGANNNIIRNNTVIGAKAVGIYIDQGSYNIVENNIVAGTSDSKYWKKSTSVGPGLGVNTENIGSNGGEAIGNIFRNNLIAYSSTCLWVGAQTGRDVALRSGVEFIGNTCVGADYAISAAAAGDRVDKVTVKNNIFHQITNPDSCQVNDANAYTFNNNVWPTRQSNSICQGNNDAIGDPKLNKTKGWRALNVGNMPSEKDFTPAFDSISKSLGAKIINLTEDFKREKRPDTPSAGAIEVSPISILLSTPSGISFQVLSN